MHWIKIYDEFGTFLKKVPALKKQNLFNILQKSGFSFPQNCGGIGKCKKCYVYILSPYSSKKEKVLSCQYTINHDLKVFIPITNYNIYSRIEIQNVKRKKIIREKSIPYPPTPEEKNLIHYVEKSTKRKILNKTFFINSLSEDFFLKKEIKLFISSKHIFACKKKYKYFLLLDLGTTTLNLVIKDFSSNTVLTHSIFNPQIKYGSDIISRINSIIENKHLLKEMSESVLNTLIFILNENNISPHEILCIIIAGNAVMEHIFAEISPISIGFAPFIPIWNGGEWRIKENFLTYFFPIINGFLGGDILADLYYLNEEDNFLLIDLGTNGEIALKSNGRIIATSCAAGPAFEGGNIELGMPAIKGAIYKIKNGEISTIENSSPKGICGSGIIDFIFEIYGENIINKDGTIIEGKKQSNNFIIKKEKVFLKNTHIYLTQKDIREFQNAKSAIWTGIKILLREAKNYHINKIFIGGGFSHYINTEALFNLKIFPDEIRNIPVISLGNVTLKGIEKFLLNIDRYNREILKIQKSIFPIDLAMHPLFNDLFPEGMFLA